MVKQKLLLSEFLQGVKTVIADEVHPAKAEVLKKLPIQHLNQNHKMGLTGTVPKEQFEFQAILAGIGPVINQISAKELQEKGVLSNCHVNIVQMIDTLVHKNYPRRIKISQQTKTGSIHSKLIEKILIQATHLYL